MPKGKPAALAYVSDFIEEVKASGLVRKALDEMGLQIVAGCPGGDETLDGRYACLSGVVTVKPSSSFVILIWQESREFGRTS